MDIYSLTRKKRPSHLTLAQPTSRQTLIETSPAISTSLLNQSINLGPPTRNHWKPDAIANHCDYLGCSTTFGLFERRHHCRKCGDIFCAQHCSNYFRLDGNAQFHVRGQLARGCDGCAKDYREWRLNSAKTIKDEGVKHKKSGQSRLKGIMTQQPQAMEGITELGRDDIVGPQKSNGLNITKTSNKGQVTFDPIPSVPADWQWSTF
ncbi:uncharacterized protein BX663DRAFT_189153 [Cokeromyces recurvatus]|uniref:uncharacterized protein n=1 Tax=Cokeromyces recurvatus TaxID=90255 RepID=UPI0022204B6C|nr:uncharacterized protein BX663DRAFT_189153 [Cokeromyces recurvatus]KAI7906319.1 hypothetical protein BX663DRAFT_189153 [Cokeromyces recurvatus]